MTPEEIAFCLEKGKDRVTREGKAEVLEMTLCNAMFLITAEPNTYPKTPEINFMDHEFRRGNFCLLINFLLSILDTI